MTSMLSGKVDLSAAGYCSPWRFVMIAEQAGQLVEKNDLLLNLNEPCRIADTTWITHDP